MRIAALQVVHKVGTHKRAFGSWPAFVVRRRQVLFQPNLHFHLSLIPFLTTRFHRLARLNTPEIIILSKTHPDMTFLCPPFHNSGILGKQWVGSATQGSGQSADGQLSIKVSALLHPPAVNFPNPLVCLFSCLYIFLFVCFLFFNKSIRPLLHPLLVSERT